MKGLEEKGLFGGSSLAHAGDVESRGTIDTTETATPPTTPQKTSRSCADDATWKQTADLNDLGNSSRRTNQKLWPPPGIKPYYADDYAVVIHGDCREILPGLSPVDLVLTDPPYGIGRDGKPPSTSSHGGHKGYQFLGWDHSRPSGETLETVLAKGRHGVVWGGQYFADLLPPSRGWLVWDKGQRIDQADAELAWTDLDIPVRVWVMNRVHIAKDGAVHPTQKPKELFQWCLGFFPDAQTILDPFMGSGTTLVAAKNLGRKSIGIEIEEKYCEIAAQRLSQGILDLETT